MKSKAVKLSGTLMELAEKEATVMTRSAAGQIEHWAMLGRSVEQSGQLSHSQVQAFLSGQVRYDDLTALDQALGAEKVVEYLEGAKVRDTFLETLRTSGIGYSGLDVEGRKVRVLPDGTLQPMGD